MIPKTLAELSALLDVLREKHVAHFETGDLKILLGGEEAEVAMESAVPEEQEKEEEPSPATGLTPTQEKELFYSTE